MKISWNWLGRHVDLSGLDPFDVAHRFTMSVAELDGVEEFGKTYHQVVAAKVLAIALHPAADHVRIVELDTGSGKVSLVSGAPNLRLGMMVPYAPPGVKLEGMEEKPVVAVVTIRGVTSPGVVCSERELGISDDHSGVMELPQGTVPGTRLTDLAPIHDIVLEIDNTSITHRPDLWGHRGIAREIAALVGRTLRPFEVSIPEGSQDVLSVSVEAPELCPRYTALVFDEIQVLPSPLWLKCALSLVGIRPINNVVDLTNFVMMDVANPMHAFDARFVAGNTIVVRNAEPGEEITTLDGQVRDLLPSDTVIADGERAVALGGVMGGENSQILPDTRRVVLESASFQPSAIRKTSARLGLRTDASARFEKGLDRIAPLMATSLFARLLPELAPGSKVLSRFYDVQAPEVAPTVITVKPSWIRKKLGAPVSDQTMIGMLERIEFRIDVGDDEFRIHVPTFRATRDITIPEDIVEEIGRLYGYDNIVPTPILAPVEPPPRLAANEIQPVVVDTLVGLGYQEILSYSFDSAQFANQIGYSLEGTLELRNPISADMPVMRRSLLPNMLLAAGRNAQEWDDFRIFETGRVFFTDPDGEIPYQERHVAGVLYSRYEDNFDIFRKIRGDVEALLGRLHRGSVRFVMPDGMGNMPWTIPEKARSIEVAGHLVGYVSLLNPIVRDTMKLRGKVALFELNLEQIFELPEVVPVFQALPRFPSIEQDISVIVECDTPFEDVERVILMRGTELLQRTELVAVFKGNPIPEGKKSISFRLEFRSAERTLTDEDVSPVMSDILAGLKAEVQGEIRT